MADATPRPDPESWGPASDHQAEFDRRNRERFDAAPLCERCKRRPPTDIMRYTSYCAVCAECRDFLLEDIARAIQEATDELKREGY